MNVLHFTPRGELSANENLLAFIEVCRRSDVLSASSQFDSNTWVEGFRKGKANAQRIKFSTLESCGSSRSEEIIPMPEPFLSFAKATLVYLQDMSFVVSQGARIAALRCLEAALRSHAKDSRPTGVAGDVLDTSVETAIRRYSLGVAYRVAGQLEAIANLMREKGFVEFRTRWAHGLKKPRELGSRISKEALEARQEKLPSAAAIRALGGIFGSAEGAGDNVIACLTTLMICAPQRVNEVVRLRPNCLVEGEGRFAGQLGLRWPGSKLAEDTTKWLPTRVAPIAREAIERLTQTTASARELARWYEDNPDKLFLHVDVEHLRRRELLDAAELGQIIWGAQSKEGSANSWAKGKGLDARPIGGRKKGYRFCDVERAILSMLPPTFPFVPGDPMLKCRDVLALVHRNELRTDQARWLCMFDCVDQSDIAARLGASEATGIESLFSRYGFSEDDGSPIIVNTHAFRHYLNMLAQVGGLSDTEIAIFSGRKDERQNRAYDHMSADEVQAPIAAAISGGFMGQLVPASGRNLIERDAFVGLDVAAAHTTEYGYCVHNYASEPCQLHRDCLNCSEQVCVKGEHAKEQNLRRLRQEAEQLLGRARTALGEEEYGADAWVRHQTQTLERVDQLLAMFDDPAVPAGAQIRLHLDGIPLVRSDEQRVTALPVSPVRAIR